MDFLQLDSLEIAIAKLKKAVTDTTETILLPNAHGRVLAEDFISKQNIPPFQRSSVDGYAVKTEDVAGAGESSPAFLQLVGTVLIGHGTSHVLQNGQCIEVPTGGMIPEGTTAVVMLEYVENFAGDIAVLKPAAMWENIVDIGDDVKTGEKILPAGTYLGAKEIGALAALGTQEVTVFTRPKVAIISTGDELVPYGEPTPPPLGKIHDISSHTLKIICEQYGMDVIHQSVLPDNADKLATALTKGMETSDFVLISGGSSYGKHDITADVISSVCKPGIFTHGLALKPGKPTILAVDDSTKTMVLGIPGHPVSAMIVLELLLKGLAKSPPPPAIPATLATNTPADGGKKTIIPCSIILEGNHYTARPIFGKSATITTLTHACGYFVIDEGTEGLLEGSQVVVNLL